VKGVFENLDQIDPNISEHSQHWDIDRMATVDRCILRLAVFELFHRGDIPRNVTINEAVEMAHKYSTPDSGSFINGILDNLNIQERESLIDS